MFFATLYLFVIKLAKSMYRMFSRISKSTLIKKFTNNIKNLFSKIPLKDFFGDYFRTERLKMSVTAISFVCVLCVLFALGSVSRVAVYVDGQKIGYAENAEEAISIVDEYNEFAETNHGTSDIILQNEISLSQNLLSGDALQQTLDAKKNEEFTNAYMLYLDDVLVATTENPYILRETLSQIENDVGKLLGYNASIYNSIEIKNEFRPTKDLTDPSTIYASICGFEKLVKENIMPSVLLNKINEPVKLYSVNGILFEIYEYYKVERTLEYTTIQKEDANLYEGTQKLETVGSEGLAIDTYKRTIFEGKPQSSELIDTSIETAKVDTVILNGTKKINWSENPKVLLFPLTTSNFNYSSEFGNRRDPFTGEADWHSGIDLGVGTGNTVIASSSGVVTKSTDHGDTAGIYIEIKHDNGLITRYLHLSKRLVKVGDKVYAGQQIALSGNTGRSTGPHLHFTVLDINGNIVNPRLYTQMP